MDERGWVAPGLSGCGDRSSSLPPPARGCEYDIDFRPCRDFGRRSGSDSGKGFAGEIGSGSRVFCLARPTGEWSCLTSWAYRDCRLSRRRLVTACSSDSYCGWTRSSASECIEVRDADSGKGNRSSEVSQDDAVEECVIGDGEAEYLLESLWLGCGVGLTAGGAGVCRYTDASVGDCCCRSHCCGGSWLVRCVLPMRSAI